MQRTDSEMTDLSSQTLHVVRRELATTLNEARSRSRDSPSIRTPVPCSSSALPICMRCTASCGW